MKILILEDDEILLETIQELLEDNGYLVDIAINGDEVLDLTFENKYSLYIFDVNVPKMNGFELLEELRKAEDNTPVIYITALVDINSISQGFHLGASDYLKKPFHPNELILRVENLLDIPKIIKYQNLEIKQNHIFKDNKEIFLTEIQSKIFSELVENIGQVVETETLYNLIENSSNSALRFHINKLRNILEIEIKNIRGIGYILEDSKF